MLALTYLLALGVKLDMVLFLDGFNDVVLPEAENAPRGISPYYPRLWSLRVGALGTRERLLAARIDLCRDRRSRLSSIATRRPLCWSATAALVMRRLDAVMLGEERQLADELLDSSSREEESYQALGPSEPEEDPQHRLADLARFWARCSEIAAGTCAGNGIEYYHFLQPNQYVADSKPMAADERALAIQPDSRYGRWALKGYPHLQSAGRHLADEGVPFFDLTPVLSRVARPVYLDACCHLTQDGNRIVGRVIGRAILAARAGHAATARARVAQWGADAASALENSDPTRPNAHRLTAAP